MTCKMFRDTFFSDLWPVDSVGRLMAAEPVALPPRMRVNEAIERIRQVGLPGDALSGCYVVEEDYALRGVVTIRTLILSRGSLPLEQVMEPPFVTLQPTDDRELAAQLMREFDLLELPVVDRENRLLGLVTADDAMDVLQEEATEDMEKMAAITPSEQPYLQTGVWGIFRSRILWLMLLMLSATFTGAIITRFEDALRAQVALTAFIPMLMDTGGNCGSQSSVTVIRGLSLGEIQYGDWLRVVWKELRVAVLCGLALAAVIALRILLLDRLDGTIALAVALTLAATVLLSKLIGALLPILARRLGMDPAVMASPLITTVVDTVSLLVYFRIAAALLGL